MRHWVRNGVVGVLCTLYLLPLVSHTGPGMRVDALDGVLATLAVLMPFAIAGTFPPFANWAILVLSWVVLPMGGAVLLVVSRNPSRLPLAELSARQLAVLTSFFRLAGLVLVLFSALYGFVLARHWSESRRAPST